MDENGAVPTLPERARPSGRDFGFAGIAVALTVAMWLAGWLAPLERSAGDALLRLTHRSTTDGPVVAVVIDDASVAAVAPLPWPRILIADLVSASHRAGAAAVVVDLLLVEARDTVGDLELGVALGEGPSLMAAALGHDRGWLLPHPRFGGIQRAAHVHADVGPDGVARTLSSTKQADDLALPALSLAAARVLRPEIVIVPGEVLRPGFRPAPDRIQTISAADILSSDGFDRSLTERLVFIGITAAGAGDRFMVPTCPGPAPSPGVLVHASAAASILQDGLVHVPQPTWILLGLALAALAPQLRRTRNGKFDPWVTILGTISIVLLAAAVLEFWNLLLPSPTLIVVILVSAGLREAAESRDARRESGRLLQSLLLHHDPNGDSRVPNSSVARLSALRSLQTAVLDQDAARRTLLEGMHDGVVMWDADGRVMVVNPAATRLWGSEPNRSDLESLALDQDGNSTTILDRHGRSIAVAIFAIGDGGMALLRDVTAERELERKRRDMQRMVSHELKTPLASIAGFGETLQRYELTEDEQHRVASLIRGESERLGEMVATFLDLERLGSDQFIETTESLVLGSLVEERLEILSQAAHLRTQKIVSKIESGVLVQASAALLARVVDNLVGNALKYSAEGGVVEVAVRKEDESAILTIIDDGAGIPEDAIPRLFERFYRVPGVRGSGSGLGLAVANEVVTWHGGCIEVMSRVGFGSTFTVKLPAEE